MTQIQVKLPIRFKLKDTEAFKDALVEYLKNHRKLKPVRFGFGEEYAESLEYGTGPLNQYQPTVHGGNYTYKTIYDAIYEWAGKKDGHGSGLPIEDPAEHRRFAKKVTDDFFMYGMKPHPYWRPAINFLLDNEQRMFDEGHSLFEIADEALRVANKCIVDQNLPFKGRLQRSAVIEEIDPRIVKDGREYKDYSDDEWEDLYKKGGW